MRRVSRKHVTFFLRWFLRYNTALFWLQARMPELPKRPNQNLARLLDSRRQAAQLKIFDIIGDYGHLCNSCGRCCLDRVERYTDFDQFIHAGIGEPLDHFDRRILNLPSMIKNSMRLTLKRLLGNEHDSQELCRYLGESGCTTPHQKRPMLCASWFCPKYIFGMRPSSLDSLEEPLNEILLIHREVAATVSSKEKA